MVTSGVRLTNNKSKGSEAQRGAMVRSSKLRWFPASPSLCFAMEIVVEPLVSEINVFAEIDFLNESQ